MNNRFVQLNTNKLYALIVYTPYTDQITASDEFAYLAERYEHLIEDKRENIAKAEFIDQTTGEAIAHFDRATGSKGMTAYYSAEWYRLM